MPSNYVSDSNELPLATAEVDSSDSNLRSVFRSNFAKFDWDETGLIIGGTFFSFFGFQGGK